jgi:hypothetical protein
MILFTLKYITNKITLNDLKIAERLLEENSAKIQESFYHIGSVLILT